MNYMLIYVQVLFYIKICSGSFCYWNSGCPYRYFSSKTPYNFIRGDIRDSLINIKGCEPISIWGLIRHGKREPGISFAGPIEDVLQTVYDVDASYKAGRSSLCAQDVENLKNWPMDYKLIHDHNRLTMEGWDEMKHLGKRLQQAFPKLLGELPENSYHIQSEFGDLIEDSAKAFVQGFDDILSYTTPEFTPELEFSVAAPYVRCIAYQKYKNDSETYTESNKYYLNPEYLAMKDRIQRRSGLSYALTDTNVSALYDLCRYTSSGYDNRFSPWCALFTTEDLALLEYTMDLRHYYRDSYGTPMAEKFGRVPLTDLLKNFKLAKENKGKKMITYITHATMLDMTYTALGLFKPESPLNGTRRNPKRKFRSTKMAPFTGNFFAVLNRCSKNKEDEYNVIFYMNEQPLISICKDRICSWKEFEEKFTFDKINLDFCGGYSEH